MTPEQELVIRWAWQSEHSPPEIHDLAARLLGEPSLACGFADEIDIEAPVFQWLHDWETWEQARQRQIARP